MSAQATPPTQATAPQTQSSSSSTLDGCMLIFIMVGLVAFFVHFGNMWTKQFEIMNATLTTISVELSDDRESTDQEIRLLQRNLAIAERRLCLLEQAAGLPECESVDPPQPTLRPQ